MMDLKQAMEYLVEIGTAQMLEVNGQRYSTQKLHLVPQPTAAAITVSTLAGLNNYIQSKFDGDRPLMVHIESPTSVTVHSTLNDDENRTRYLVAKAILPGFHFGRFFDVEAFNIGLQAMFVNTEERAKVLQIVGNVKDGNVTNYGDDGVSQSVTAKAGVATVATVPVPNPVYLKPFRTFVEVEQPESAFVFRMRKGDQAPEAALFEADGGAWKIEAVDRIRDFLEAQLEGCNVTLIS